MNEEIRKVLKMSKEGTLNDDEAAELIAELTKKESRSSRDWRKESTEDLGDTISRLIGKTMDGAINMSGMASLSSSHIKGFSPHDLQDNSFHMSKLEGPSGGEYVFKDNQIRMSHLKKLTLDRSEFVSNQVDASKINQMTIADSKFGGSIIQASAIVGLVVDRSQISDSKILSSKWVRVSIDSESSFDSIKFNACAVKDMKISQDSHWQKSVISGVMIAHLTSENSNLSDVEWQQAHVVHTNFLNSSFCGVLLRGIQFSHTKFVDCKMTDVLFTGGNEKWSWKPWKNKGFEHVSFEGCKFDKVLISNCSWNNVTIKNVTLADFKIQDVNLSGVTLDGNEEFLKALKESKSA